MIASRLATTGEPGDAQYFQPEFSSPETTAPPDEVEILDGERFMFKQDGSMFKLVVDGGKVIGLLYKKQRDGGEWTALGLAQVKSRFEIYQRRAGDGDGTENARRWAACWGWALSLFGTTTFNKSM